MKFQLLTVAAALSGLSAALPGKGWGDASWPATSALSTPSGDSRPPFATTTPVKPSGTPPAPPAGPPKGSGPAPPSGPSGTPPAGPPAGPPSGSPPGPPSGGPTPSCPSFPTSCYLTDAKATSIIATYETLINRDIHGAEFNATANALLADSYFLQSNSVNADEGLPLNTVSIPNKQTFISLFWNVPTGAGEITLDLFHSCSQIAWRWTGTNPAGQLVRGMTMMNITSSFQVGPTFTEYFNPTLDRCTNSTS